MIILTELELKHVDTPSTTFFGKLFKKINTDIIWGIGNKIVVNPATVTYIEKFKYGSKIWFGPRDWIRVEENIETILNLINEESRRVKK